MALRKLPSIWPTAAKTERPSPRESTTDVAPSRGLEIAASAQRSAGLRRARGAPNCVTLRMSRLARLSNIKAPAMPPVVQSVSQIEPEKKLALATSSATKKAVAITKRLAGRPLAALMASRNSAAARTSSVRASGQSVKIRAVRNPYTVASIRGCGCNEITAGRGRAAWMTGANRIGATPPRIRPIKIPTMLSAPICRK